MSKRWWVAFPVLLSTACGGAKHAEPKPAPKEPMLVATSAPAPLTPVPAPKELFAVARATNPGKLLDTGVAWSSLPVDWRSMLAKEAPGFERALVAGAPFDFCAMLDPASTMEPRVFWAFSFGVSSVDAAAGFFREQGGRVADAGGGILRASLGSDLACVAAPARGMAAARVVCSADAEGADALAPYMTRGLAEESLGPSEVHVHVLSEPFRRRYGNQLNLVKTMGVPFALRELSLGHPKFDRALSDALYSLADELILIAKDAERLDVDLSLSPSGDAALATGSLKFLAQESALAKAVARSASHAAPAPDAFWKLPGDSLAASFGTQADTEALRPVATSIGAVLDGWLEFHKLPDRRRVALVEAFSGAFTQLGRAVYASLPPGSPVVAKNAPSEVRGALRSLLGGHVAAIESGGERILALANEVVKSFGEKAFRDDLVKTGVFAADELPVLRHKTARIKGLAQPAHVFELEVPLQALSREKNAAGARKKGLPPKASSMLVAESVRAYLVIAPDGPLHWVALSGDQRDLVDRLAGAHAGSGPNLGTRTGLERLRTQPSVGAGFTTLAVALAGLAERTVPGGLAALQRAPHKGMTPLLWRATSDPAGPRMTFEGTLPRAVVEDIVALAAGSVPFR